jgi:acetoacetyl-CoA synthetase
LYLPLLPELNQVQVIMETHNSFENKELWRHSCPEKTKIHAFKIHVEKKYGLSFSNYKDFHRWSVTNPGVFWEEVLHWTRIRLTQSYSSVLDASAPMFPRPKFFPGCTLNFAENLLYPSVNPDPESFAVIGATETTREHVSWDSLRDRVRQCANGMRARGLRTGDRVACYLANHANALVVMLATTSVGAIWTGISPDTGVSAVLGRLSQIEPALLFADNAIQYNAKVHETQRKIGEIISSLPSLKAIVIFSTVPSCAFDFDSVPQDKRSVTIPYETFLSGPRKDDPMTFTPLPPDHPIYVLYSSGTTGAPKPIVHSALGVLLQHKKEHMLHCDIGVGDRLFYYTTITWMMAHWSWSALGSGSSVILYDGSPFQPHGHMSLPRLIDELAITHFGTSAKYLSLLEQSNLLPRQADPPAHLSSLRSILSTGSPLAPSTFEYTYRAFGPDIHLGSITGGTDILSLFGAPNPLLPVHAGEIQCAGLGMSIHCYESSTGRDITDTGEPGELICDVPFPCQPCMFWPPGPEGERKYKSAYFEMFEKDGGKQGEKVWCHGDFVRFNTTTGGMWMLGRSDGVLKPGGVRFGSSEIYNIILKHFGEEVEDSLCIGRRRDNDKDETVVLFLQMAEGKQFDEELVRRVKEVIRKELSARHVPGIVEETPAIPVTTNGKKVEGAIKQILSGTNIKTSASVANQECLDFYRSWAKKHS